jgi:ABC-type cobalamin transport system ATPase subunit
MPVFTHVLILKKGRVLAAGRKQDALTSKWLSTAFNTRFMARRKSDRYELVRKIGHTSSGQSHLVA